MQTSPDGGSKDNSQILVIDDERDVRESIVSVLQSWGYSASAAGTAREALAALDGRKVELVIVDVFMPRMDGLELAAMIRVTHPFVPIALFSGAFPDIPRTTLRDLRIEGLLSKPLRRETFTSIMQRLQTRMAATGKISVPAE